MRMYRVTFYDVAGRIYSCRSSREDMDGTITAARRFVATRRGAVSYSIAVR